MLHFKIKNVRKVDSKRRFKSTMNRTSQNQSSNFTLYGLTSRKGDGIVGQSPNFKKLANIHKIKPKDAANKFYDKHIIQALDKYS